MAATNGAIPAPVPTDHEDHQRRAPGNEGGQTPDQLTATGSACAGTSHGASAHAGAEADGGPAANGPRKKRKRRPPLVPWKKPKDMPRRPLSAYNIFFKEQREAMMRAAAESLALEKEKNRDSKTKGKNKKSNKSVGIGFANLARRIAGNWKDLDATSKAPYETRAAAEKDRYNQEMVVWRAKQKEEKDKSGQAASGSERGLVVGGGAQQASPELGPGTQPDEAESFTAKKSAGSTFTVADGVVPVQEAAAPETHEVVLRGARLEVGAKGQGDATSASSRSDAASRKLNDSPRTDSAPKVELASRRSSMAATTTDIDQDGEPIPLPQPGNSGGRRQAGQSRFSPIQYSAQSAEASAVSYGGCPLPLSHLSYRGHLEPLPSLDFDLSGHNHPQGLSASPGGNARDTSFFNRDNALGNSLGDYGSFGAASAQFPLGHPFPSAGEPAASRFGNVPPRQPAQARRSTWSASMLTPQTGSTASHFVQRNGFETAETPAPQPLGSASFLYPDAWFEVECNAPLPERGEIESLQANSDHSGFPRVPKKKRHTFPGVGDGMDSEPIRYSPDGDLTGKLPGKRGILSREGPEDLKQKGFGFKVQDDSCKWTAEAGSNSSQTLGNLVADTTLCPPVAETASTGRKCQPPTLSDGAGAHNPIVENSLHVLGLKLDDETVDFLTQLRFTQS